MGNPIKVAIPLAGALILCIVLVVLLARQSETPNVRLDPLENPVEPVEISKPAPPPKISSDLPPIPKGDPSNPNPEAHKTYPGNYHRWNLQELPRGWNDAIAGDLHELFERMNFDQLNDRGVAAEIEAARKDLEAYLAGLGPEALPTLEAILHVEPDFVARRFLFRGVGKMGNRSEEATRVLSDYYDARHGNPKNRSEMGHLIEAIGYLKNDSSLEMLAEYAQDDNHRSYRDKLITSLGDHPRREEVTHVFANGMRDSQFTTRNKAAQALGKVRNPSTLPDLYEAFDRERVWYAQQTMLGTIGKIGDVGSIPFLEEKARLEERSGLRLSAGSAIRRIVQQTGDRQGLRILESLAQNEPDEQIRIHFQRWVEEL